LNILPRISICAWLSVFISEIPNFLNPQNVIPAANGCDSTITLNLTLNFTGIHELENSTKILVKITDLSGKIIQRRKNTVMLFIYEDGTVERVVEIE